jgi:hypothetical protein
VKQQWSRADRISLATAILALVVAVAPVAIHFWEILHSVHATITTPTTGSIYHANKDPGATGTARNKPSDEDLWVVKRSGIEGRWYPAERLHIKSDGTWTTGPLRPGLGEQEFYVILVPITEDAQFIDYVNNLVHSNYKSDPGVSSLPPDSKVEAVSSVTVK